MANRGRATFAKRQKEVKRQEKAREKAAERVDRKTSRFKLDRAGPVDPDIAEVTPGPQPLPYELLDGDLTTDEVDPSMSEEETEETEEAETPKPATRSPV